jgi:pyruvate formate lyase activating enzyme
MKVDDLLSLTRSNPQNIGIAYTYNEPSVWYEYMFDMAKAMQQEGLKNVMVSNGYLNPKPLADLLPLIDAFNIDLKAFEPGIYKSFTGGELPYVKNTMQTIASTGKHLEITVLLVPEVNDNQEQFDAMIQWIRERLGHTVPLHLSRYFPRYKSTTEATSTNLMLSFAEQAKKHLDYVYIGNWGKDDFQDTYCPDCGALCIQRKGYYIQMKALDEKGCCRSCGHQIVLS